MKHVVDCQQTWGLYSDGWATGADEEGTPTFQLWPAKEYAALCASGLWTGYEPAEIPLDDLLETLLPKLQRDKFGVGIFRTPEGYSVMPIIEQLAGDLKTEMSRYD